MNITNQTRKDLSNQFALLAKKYAFFGHASLFYHNEVWIDHAYGYSDFENKIPFTKETKLSIAAVNPLFAAILILKMEAQKKLKLNDTLSQYIPEYQHAKHIKIIHLIQFRSQIPDYVSTHLMLDIINNSDYENLSEVEKKCVYVKAATKDYAFDEVLGFVNDQELIKKPGGSAEFQDATVRVFLKTLIERVSGMSYQALLEKEIFDVLNIKPDYNHLSDAKYYEQTDDIYHFEIKLNQNPIPMILLDIHQIHQIIHGITSKRVITDAIWQKMKRFKDHIGLGIFQGNGHVDFGFGYLSHYVDCFYYEDLNISMVLSFNYGGNWYMESGKWKAFTTESKKLLAPIYMYPSHPIVEKFARKNRYDFIGIEISEAQQKYVPDVYKCLAYTYNDQKCHHYILKDHGISVGMFTLFMDHKYQEYYVKFLMIDQKYQNRGYGKIMLRHAVDILKEKGAKTLEIGLVSENIAALKMYQSVGFKVFNRGQDFIQLKMDLNPLG